MDIDKISRIFSREKRIKYWDFRLQSNKSTDLFFSNKRLSESVSQSKEYYSLRVLIGNAWGFVSSSNKQALARNIEKAIKIAKALDRMRKGRVFYDSGKSYIENYVLDPKISPETSNDEKIEIVREKILEGTDVSYQDIKSTKTFLNSEGSYIKQTIFYTSAEITAIKKQFGEFFEFSSTIGGLGGLENIELLKDESERCLSKIRDLMKARQAKSRPKSLILDQGLSAVFMHEIIGHAAEADDAVSEDSYLTGFMNKEVSSEELTVYDDPLLNSFGFYLFDDEGIKAQKKPVILNGRLVSFLHSRSTGKSTGNGRAENPQYMPSPRISNIVFNGEYDFEEMLSEVKNGLYVVGNNGGETDTKNGLFEFPSKIAYIIKNGEIREPVKSYVLSGRSIEALRGIRAVGNDAKETVLMCEKNSQLIPTGNYNPSILLEMKR